VGDGRRRGEPGRALGDGDCYAPNDRSEKSDDTEDCTATRNAMGAGGTNLAALAMGCSNDNGTQNWPNWQATARSSHTGGVNATFCDGSVRFITNSVPQNVWRFMNSRNDGQTWNY